MSSNSGATTESPITPPPLPRHRLRSAWLIVAAVLLVAAAATLFAINPTSTRLFPPCPLHAVTGLHCPGCGSTRAIHHLLHGRVVTAFGFNPLMVASLPFIAFALVRRGWPADPPARPWPPWTIWALLVLVLGFGVLRNLPWQPVRWMAP